MRQQQHRRTADSKDENSNEEESAKNEERETVPKEAKDDRVIPTSKPSTKTNSFLKNVMDLLKFAGYVCYCQPNDPISSSISLSLSCISMSPCNWTYVMDPFSL